MLLLLRYQSSQAEQKDLVTAAKDLPLSTPTHIFAKSTLYFRIMMCLLSMRHHIPVLLYDKNNNVYIPSQIRLGIFLSSLKRKDLDLIDCISNIEFLTENKYLLDKQTDKCRI